MGTRRKAREAALQFLFQEDFCAANPPDKEEFAHRLELFYALYQVNKKARGYSTELLEKILATEILQLR